MRRLFLLSVFLLAGPAAANAQITETPVPFDSAGRILSIGETLATRLKLAPPAWPVNGTFVEARLFESSAGGHVIVVQRKTGRLDRYPLTADQVVDLRAAIAAGTNQAGRMVAEDAASVEVESARRPFVRNQMLLAAFMYGPAMASLMNDASRGTGAYLLSIGGTFFVITDMAKNRTITNAQNHMATDGALRGWGLTAATFNALGVSLDNHQTALSVLVGGIGGSIVGYQRAKGLTNSEAMAAMTGSTLAAVTAVGLAGSSGLWRDSTGGRAASAAAAVGGIAGYVFGPYYPRHASYTVTAGDIRVVRLGAVLGTMAAITPIVSNDSVDSQLAAGLGTAGWIAGAVLADRLSAKPYNHSSSDSHVVELGALGGALIGTGFPTIAKSDNATLYMSAATLGAIGGAILAEKTMAPPRQGAPYVESRDSDGLHGMHFSFDAQGLAMTLAKQRGNHSLLRVTF
jgi:hypothetical protein